MAVDPPAAGPILVVEHEASCPPGWLGDWLTEAGARLDVRRPYRGDALPTDPVHYGGLVVLGGSMSVDEDTDFPWLGQVKDLLRTAAEQQAPVLGICLGLQLLAVAFGGEVERNPHGQQIGVLPVGWLPAAEEDDLFGGLTRLDAAVQWNKDVVRSLPKQAVVLAETTRAEIQAARFGPSTWGVQWHPEVGEEIAAQWADEDRDAVQERGIDIDEYVAQVAAASQRLQGWRTLATRFLALTQRPREVGEAIQTAPASAPIDTAWRG